MINKIVLGIALGFFLFLGTQVKADIIYTSTLSTGTVMVFNLDTGETDIIMGDGVTPVFVINSDDDTDE